MSMQRHALAALVVGTFVAANASAQETFKVGIVSFLSGPAAEEMKKFLILYDCGTPRIFEDGKYAYVFRTASHAVMDNVALARYLKARNIKAGTVNYINQDYAWGHD